MVSRVRIATFSLFVIAGAFAYSQTQSQNSQPVSEVTGLAGKVINADGRPLSGIYVEIDDIGTAVPVMSTYTQPDGTFELYNIPKGNYEVIADADTSVVSNQVAVDSGKPSLELRLPPGSGAPHNPDATISVARMLVPPSALKLYHKAYVEFQSGKLNDAQNHLDAALLIDPQFADAIALRGLMQLGSSDPTAGRESLEKAIQLDPGNSAAYIALAAAYNHEGRFDEAIRASEKGLSLAPKAWQAYLEMAKASIAKSMYQSGLKFVRQAQRLGGNTYAEVHLVKAYALVPLKLYRDAKYELQASLSRQHPGALGEQAQNMLARLDELEKPGVAADH